MAPPADSAISPVSREFPLAVPLYDRGSKVGAENLVDGRGINVGLPFGSKCQLNLLRRHRAGFRQQLGNQASQFTALVRGRQGSPTLWIVAFVHRVRTRLDYDSIDQTLAVVECGRRQDGFEANMDHDEQ